MVSRSKRTGRAAVVLVIDIGGGLGSTLILDEVVVPLELGELRYSGKRTLSERVGQKGPEKAWAKEMGEHCSKDDPEPACSIGSGFDRRRRRKRR